MQFESFQREQPKINVSALIDVVFILLIFVVLAANFDRIQEMNVVLPSAEESTETTSDALVLTVPLEGPMLVNEQPIEEGSLPQVLSAKRADFEVLVLVGDGGIDLDQTVQIFDQASAAGFESVSIATRQKGSR